MKNRNKENPIEAPIRVERIQADPASGLSTEQVKQRFAAHADNYKVESSKMSVSDIVNSNVFT